MGYATFLQFYIHNKIEKTFRPVKLAKFLCHKVIDYACVKEMNRCEPSL